MSDQGSLHEQATKLIDIGRYKDAVALANQIEQDPIKAGILIDAGSCLKKSSIIRQGIDLLEKALQDNLSPFTKSSLLYSTANGYSELYGLRRAKVKKVIPPNDDYLRRAKNLYKQAIENLSKKDTHSFRSQLWTNYANCLSALGRSVDAISAFNKAVQQEPQNGVALGNLGIELEYFSRVVLHYRHDYILYAHELLTHALSHEAHLNHADPRIRLWYQQNLKHLQSIIDVHEGGILPSSLPVALNGIESDYIRFSHTNGLFLNAWVGDVKYAPAVTDDIHYGPIIVAIEDKLTIPSLLRILNEMKESFSTARYLFYLSSSPDPALTAISKLSMYHDFSALDLHGIPIGLLKTAYVRAFDVLDKVARVVNIYFRMGNERWSFWESFAAKESRRGGLELRYAMRPEIAQLDNYGLFALADVCVEYHENQNADFKEIDTHRNLITHDYLSVTFDEFAAQIDSKGIGLDKLKKRTLEVLQLAKSAILYAVIAVNLDGHAKSSDEFVPSIYYSTSPGHSSDQLF